MKHTTDKGFVQLPRFVTQRLADLKGSELKVMVAVCDQTTSFKVDTCDFSYQELMDRTGLKKWALVYALKALREDFKFIETSTKRAKVRVKVLEEDTILHQSGVNSTPQEVLISHLHSPAIKNLINILIRRVGFTDKEALELIEVAIKNGRQAVTYLPNIISYAQALEERGEAHNIIGIIHHSCCESQPHNVANRC